MQERPGLSALKIVLIVVGCVVAGLVMMAGLASLLLPALQRANELANRTVCMSSLKSIGMALTLYKGTNDNQWPWLTDKCTGWETNRVGLNREVKNDPTVAPERSITGLMFLLVRENQPQKLFICPTTTDVKDNDIKDTANAKDDQEPEYFWDFSGPENVSYSWQAPIKGKDGKYHQGLSDNDNDTVVIADKSPRWGTKPWSNTAWDPALTGSAVRPHMSRNHRGEVVNVLYVGINVNKVNRPDVGCSDSGGAMGGPGTQPGSCDMIYTASGQPTAGSAKATSISIADHLSTRDTFLWGPVEEQPVGVEAKGR
jgi:type II secretory pathway pseudopilin PulG